MKHLEESNLPPIKSTIEAADNGDFDDAAQRAQPLGGLLPVGLYRALSVFPGSPAALGACLDAARSGDPGVRRVFSTWDKPSAADWLGRGGAAGLVVEGTGIVRTTANTVELVTLGDQVAAARYEGLPAGGTCIVHMLASFPSNVGDNFYLALEGPDGNEAIRCSNSNVALAADGAVCNVAGRVPKLYTLQVSASHARLYINGVLQKSKLRAKARSFSGLAVRLIGEHGPDLSGCVHGLEIQHAASGGDSVFGDNQALFLSRLREALALRDAGEVYQLLRGIDDEWVRELDDELLALLDAHVEERGVQEWVYDQILARVSPARARAWVDQHQGSLPAPILSVCGLSAEFMLTPNKRFALGALLRRQGQERFLVLDDINFDVFPGDIVGIIGPNGAGKSTLLRAIAGLMPINAGEITLRAHHLLLSAGIGARNELTGRENIYLAGSFMGLTKSEIDRIFDEVWEFSELGKSIDKPFKYYSDGMKGRLVFSLATSVSPQLLMLDELLGAGDIKFQKKAAERMESLLDRAKSVVIVTHSVPFVAQRCNKALLVAGGRLAAYGDPKEVIAHYLNLLHLGDVPGGGSDFNPLEMNLQQQQQAGGFGVGIR